MRGLVGKLLGFLNRVWSRDPVDVLALRLTCDGADLTWSVRANVLTTAPAGGTAAPLFIDLSLYTVTTLAAYLAAQTGYTVSYVDTGSVAGLSALCLRDQSGDVAASNGDHIYAATNPIYLLFGAIAQGLRWARSAIVQMLLQMQIPTAAGEWLDFHGKYYVVPRNLGEPDPSYSARIVPQVLLPKGNNVAIANVVSATFGQPVRVVDAVTYAAPRPQRNGTIQYDGTNLHQTVGSSPTYGLFDIQVGQDILGTGDPLPAAAVRAVVEKVRDAGTQLRSIVGIPSALTDQAMSPSGDVAEMTVVTRLRRNGTYLRNRTVTYSGSASETETLAG